MILTGVLVFMALMLRDLNAVAPLITMFFLITYTMINVVVLIEQYLGLVSFRPTFRIPILIPFLGTVGCIFAMFIVNPTFGIIAVAIVLAIYAYLIQRKLKAPFGDVRSGLFEVIAEWAARKVNEINVRSARTWKANILVPTVNAARLQRLFYLIRDLTAPGGLLKIVGLSDDEQTTGKMVTELPRVTKEFKEEGIFSSWTVITASTFGDNLKAGVETFGGTFFKPNTMVLDMPETEAEEDEVEEIISVCRGQDIGVLLIDESKEKQLGLKKKVNVWFNDRGPDWELSMDLGNQDLAVLYGFKLAENWDAELNFLAKVSQSDQKSRAIEFLKQVGESARIEQASHYSVIWDLDQTMTYPSADIHFLPMPESFSFNRLRQITETIDATCIYSLDSGQENALV